jgi:hypothetical protein
MEAPAILSALGGEKAFCLSTSVSVWGDLDGTGWVVFDFMSADRVSRGHDRRVSDHVTAALSPWPAVLLACAAPCMLQVLTGASALANRWTGTPRGLAADNVIDPARFHRAAR